MDNLDIWLEEFTILNPKGSIKEFIEFVREKEINQKFNNYKRKRLKELVNANN